MVQHGNVRQSNPPPKPPQEHALASQRMVFENRCDKSELKHMGALPMVVFDVNETVLDVQTKEPLFERIFDEKNAMRLWFANLILYFTALTVAGCYVPFTGER
jgi:hypothetical protein